VPFGLTFSILVRFLAKHGVDISDLTIALAPE
jgi:hypothetical protein